MVGTAEGAGCVGSHLARRTLVASCPPWLLLLPCRAGMYLGAKIGVLGSNGAGKSSLMRILAGVDDKFDGQVVRAPGIR